MLPYGNCEATTEVETAGELTWRAWESLDLQTVAPQVSVGAELLVIMLIVARAISVRVCVSVHFIGLQKRASTSRSLPSQRLYR